MRYVQFFQMSTGYVQGSVPPLFYENNRTPIKACGDRGVVRVDGRISRDRVAAIARRTAIERGYVGYQVLEGDSFLSAKPVSGYWPVEHCVDRTADSASYGA